MLICGLRALGAVVARPALYARVTQWLEYCLHMAGVAGSNPATRTAKRAGRSQV